MAQQLNIRLDPDVGLPLYRQIYAYIRREIRSGSLRAGERLPSTRSLAADLHVARSTAESAYDQLLSEGYLRAKKKSGYYVNDIENLTDLHLEEDLYPQGGLRREGLNPLEGLRPQDLLHLQDGPHPQEVLLRKEASGEKASLGHSVPATWPGRLPDQSGCRGRRKGPAADLIDFSPRHTEMAAFPYSTWKRIMREVMVDANAEVFSLGEAQGDESLRTTIARYLHFSRGVRCTSDQVIVGAGNDYLFMLLRHILGEGQTIAMENPTYLRAAQIFRSFGYRLAFVDMDGDGMDPESVRRSGAALVYTMPAHQFPMGCVMPVGRRAALLGWAQESEDRFIIEDDYDSEFRFRGKPIPSLQSLDATGHVIYMGTFSKAIAPGIRISYMILPPVLLARYRRNCSFFSSTVSRIDQRILDEFMKNGHFERYLNKMRGLYRARHDELLDCLRPFRGRFRVRGEGTGLHLLLEAVPGSPERQGQDLPADPCLQEQALAQLALRQGARVYCLSDFMVPTEKKREEAPSVLLGFGALEPARIREGVRRLGKAWGIKIE